MKKERAKEAQKEREMKRRCRHCECAGAGAGAGADACLPIYIRSTYKLFFFGFPIRVGPFEQTKNSEITNASHRGKHHTTDISITYNKFYIVFIVAVVSFRSLRACSNQCIASFSVRLAFLT